MKDVRDLVFERDRGALLRAVDGPEGWSLPFTVWFDLVSRYVLRPL